MVVAGAMHEVVVGPEQSRLLPCGAFRRARRSPRVGGYVTRTPVRARAPCGRRARPPPRPPQSGPRIAIASVTRPSSLASRPLRSNSMRSRGCGTLGERRASLLGRRLGGAVGEHGADAAVDQAVDRTLGQLDRGDVVAPVDQRGHAAVDLPQRADQVAEIVVLGPVARRQIEDACAGGSSAVIHSAPMPRSAVSQVCICAFTRPGITILSVSVDHLVGRRIETFARPLRSRLPREQQLPALEIADAGGSSVTSQPHLIRTRCIGFLSVVGWSATTKRPYARRISGNIRAFCRAGPMRPRPARASVTAFRRACVREQSQPPSPIRLVSRCMARHGAGWNAPA